MNYQSSIVVEEAHNSHYVHTRDILATARCSGRTTQLLLRTCKLSNNDMQTKNEVEKGHYVSCAVLQKIDPLKILHVVKLPIYSDRAHRDESNGLITGKNNTTCVVRFFHPTLQLINLQFAVSQIWLWCF